MKYKLFGHSGLRVSSLCMGTMGFGTENGWGTDKKQSQELFEIFVQAGGNFFDTANFYTQGSSEKMLGEFIRHERDRHVVATKYTLKDKDGDPNFAGNHRKNMMRSVRESLKRMQTEYIDILWLHAWDFTTEPEEVMRGLDDLITRGLVNYIGISDTPAWIVAHANTLAQLRGWNRFAGLQVEYSLINRTAERDLLPMSKFFDLTLTPWAPLAGGALSGKYLKGGQGRLKPESKRLNEKSQVIVNALMSEAEVLGISPVQLALKWCMQRGLNVIPIIGSTKKEQLVDALQSVHIPEIPITSIQKLDAASAIELGFPHDFLNEETVKNVVFGGVKERIENHRDYKLF